MSNKNDDISGRGREGRYDLPSGTYEIMETDVSGMAAGSNTGTAVGRRVVATYRPAYLSEDETVLACCHHAHEVAKAHGAREVMLEHLVHALVRVPESAQVLQDRGINVESLKRESAAVISSEIPVDHTMMVAQLRASKDFNTVMHLAAAAASRRDERMLGTRDLLEALLRFDPKSRVVRMLRRHAIEGELDDPVDPLVEVKAVIDRYAAEQRDLRLAINELRNAQAGQTASAVSGLEDRLRGLDRALNLLTSDQTGERGLLVDRLKVFHETLSAQRNDTRMIADRLQGIERLGGAPDSGQLQTLIGDRFLSVQKALENQRLDFARIDQAASERMRALDARLAEASKAAVALPPGLETLGDRMQGVERQIGAQRAELQAWQGTIAKDMKALEEMFDLIPTGDVTQRSQMADPQVAALQQTVDGHRADTQRLEASLQERHRSFERMLDVKLGGVASIGDRLGNVERALATQRTDQAGVRGTLDSELEQIRKAMLALGNAQQTLSGAIDEWRQNNSGDLSVISNRLAALERIATPAVALVQAERSALTPAQSPVIGSAPTSSMPLPPAQAAQFSPTSALLDRVDRALAGRGNGNGK